MHAKSATKPITPNGFYFAINAIKVKLSVGYHCSCLAPELFAIPEGDWFCPPCQQGKLIDALESKLVEYDGLVKQKEVEEAQRQRIPPFNSINEANVVLQDSKRDCQRARTAEYGESDDGSSESENVYLFSP